VDPEIFQKGAEPRDLGGQSPPEAEAKCEIGEQFQKRFPVDNLGFNK